MNDIAGAPRFSNANLITAIFGRLVEFCQKRCLTPIAWLSIQAVAWLSIQAVDCFMCAHDSPFLDS
jgi:hypothetical protein